MWSYLISSTTISPTIIILKDVYRRHVMQEHPAAPFTIKWVQMGFCELAGSQKHKEDHALTLRHISLNQCQSVNPQEHAVTMVSAQTVSAAVQEMAILSNRLMSQILIMDVLRAFLWPAHGLVGSEIITFWNLSTLPILLIYMKTLQLQGWCQGKYVKHFAYKTAPAKLLFSGTELTFLLVIAI